MPSLRLLLVLAPLAQAFAPVSFGSHRVSNTILSAAVSYEDISDIGYEVSVQKPLGVVFGENADPYKGLTVDDVEPGLNGGISGLRVGDQLVSINGKAVVGGRFDDVMDMLINAPSSLELQLYRGNVRSLYIILENRGGDNPTDQPDEDDGEEEVIMDENYESPVVIDISKYNTEPLSMGDFVNAFKNVMKKDEKEAPPAPAPAAAPKQETQKSGGIFGMFKQETIQLDGDDASGTAEK